MNVDRFVRERQPGWDELEGLLRAARGRLDRLDPADALHAGRLYRAAAADLAIARRAFAAEPVVERLGDLVSRGRIAVYREGAPRPSLRRFASTGAWLAIAERPAPLLVAAALLFVPAVVAFAWAVGDPGAASGLAPSIFRSLAERGPPGSLPTGGSAKAALSGAIFTNNVRVAALAFAGCAVLAIPTAIVLVMNGAIIGVIGGLATSGGNGAAFFSLVSPHGFLELSCIVVAGAAGLRSGWAIVVPGTATRASALAAEAARAVRMLVAIVPWLALAGIVESFVTPAALDVGPAAAIGVALAAAFWVVVVWRGRRVGDESSRGSRSGRHSSDARGRLRSQVGADAG